MFADLAMGPGHPQRAAVLHEAALFNVAIALFDTVLDDTARDEAPLLMTALHPARLAARLDDLRPSASLQSSAHARVHGLVGLFDATFLSIAQRFTGRSSAALTSIKQLLSRMYASETRARADRTEAKALPVVFYGVLPDGGACPERVERFTRLGRLVAWLDDWKDLQCDTTQGRANLWVSRLDSSGLVPLRYLARAAWTHVRMRVQPRRVTNVLGEMIDATLAGSLGAERDKLIACMAMLLDGVDT